MKIKTTPRTIWDEYSNGQTYNQSQGLYETVEKNEKFYLGDQWDGVNAPNLMKPVFNLIKRVCTYYTAMIVSDNVGVNIEPFDTSTQNKAFCSVISKEIEKVLERDKTNFKCRTNLKNCAVDGDTCMFVTFDPDIETNQDAKGEVRTEIIDNTNVIFGNPYSIDVQSQPYILIVQRLYKDTVKDMAEAWGVSKEDIESIHSDSDPNGILINTDSNELVTVITKFWKVKKEETVGIDPLTKTEITKNTTSVHYMKCTENVVLKEETDTGYVNYPVAYMTWERRKNSYHGQSPITGLIPNQIFINKIFAMCMVYMTNMGFPKIFYDQTKLGKLTNDVTKAVSLPNMDMAGKMMDSVKAPDFSNQIIQLIDSTIQYTKDFMGASDAALGELSNPNNTSAIVAVQQASSVPLEIQKLDFYQFYEDIVRSIIDIMSESYGIRQVRITEAQAKDLGLVDRLAYMNPTDGTELPPQIDPLTGQQIQPVGSVPKVIYKTTMQIDFSTIKNLNYDLNVEIGQSSYWSEATQVQTLDGLWDKGVITDAVAYLEGIPDKYLPNKKELIDSIKKVQDQTQLQAQMMPPVPPMADEALQPTTETQGMKDGVDNRAGGGDPTNKQLQDTYAASKEFYQ